MFSAIEVAVISPSSSSFPTRAAFAPPGPGATCSPTSSLICSPPTPHPRRPRLWFPSPLAYLDAGASSWPHRACACQRAVCSGNWSPAPRSSAGMGSRRNEALPGFWAVLFVRAASTHHAGCGHPRHLGIARRGLRSSRTLGHPESSYFRSWLDAARALACVRIAASRRREASQGSLPGGWLHLPGRDSHPLDDLPNFGSYRIAFLPSDQPFLVAPTMTRSETWRMNSTSLLTSALGAKRS